MSKRQNEKLRLADYCHFQAGLEDCSRGEMKHNEFKFALSIERTPMKVVDIFPHSGEANKIFPDSGESSKNGGKMFPDSDKGKDKRLKSAADSLD